MSKSISRYRQMAAVGLLLALLFAQLLGAATSLSATIDEGFHITSGYEYLRTGRTRLFDEHTPLAKALFAWPLFFVPDLTAPERTAGWVTGDLIGAAQESVLAYRPLDRVIVACRVPAALLTVLLAASDTNRFIETPPGVCADSSAIVPRMADPGKPLRRSFIDTHRRV